MRITKITLTNFRSFKSSQSIELAPVTLLFGPNSVGKSSVLMALAYIQQILKKGHCNPQKLDALGNRNIGGFRSLVHGQDTKQAIKVRIDYDASKTPFVHYGNDVDDLSNHIGTANYLLMSDFGGSVESGAIEFEIRWSSRHEWAYVKNYRVWINGGYIGCVTSSEDLNNTGIIELNTGHPLLVPDNNDDWLESWYGPEDERESLESDEVHTEFEQILNYLNPNPEEVAAVADTESIDEDFTNRISPVSILCRNGAIPILDKPVITNLDGQDFDDLEQHLNFLVVQSVLSQAFVLPLDKILEGLEKCIQIGPLRVVPDSDYVPDPHSEQSGWVDGSAAWSLLYKDPNSNDSIKRLIRKTSEWFSSTDKLDSGYEIINQSLSETLYAEDISTRQIESLLNKRHVFFKELRTGISLSANQLGTGISQVLPIVVAANNDDLGLISIEQPELHIHPRFQVELADVFLHSKNDHPFLIETHSEHMILRMLRRIRQTTDDELEEGLSPVTKDDVSIVYLEPSDGGVIAKRIQINEDGEFESRWPHGFFVERREELL